MESETYLQKRSEPIGEKAYFKVRSRNMTNNMEVEIFYDDKFLVVQGLDAALDGLGDSTTDKEALYMEKIALLGSVAQEMANLDKKNYGKITYFWQLARQVREKLPSCDIKMFDALSKSFIEYLAESDDSFSKAILQNQ